MEEVNHDKRDLLRRAWKVPAVIALGTMTQKPVLGGSCIHLNPGGQCNDVPCNKPNPPWWCNS